MKALILFSHKLTPEQKADLQQSWRCETFIYLPQDLQKLFSGIPPELDSLKSHISPLVSWLSENGEKNDPVLIQGEYGQTFLLVQHCLRLGLIPVYATTAREAREVRLDDGTVETVREFRHVRFRRYEIDT